MDGDAASAPLAARLRCMGRSGEGRGHAGDRGERQEGSEGELAEAGHQGGSVE